MGDQIPADWPRRVLAALELGDVKGPNASTRRRGPDRIAGLAKALGWSPAKVRRTLKRTDWEPYELESVLRRVADATSLPYGFFTVDFSRLGPRNEERPRDGDHGGERLERGTGR